MSQSLINPMNLAIPADWNRTEMAYPPVCVHELFEQQVERTPNRIAACFNEHQLTYCELNARANQLANYLVKLGVGPEVLVGVSLPRSLDMLIGVLGILKAGGAYVFLDPAYPADRLSFMLEDSQAQLLLAEQEPVVELHTRFRRTLALGKERGPISTQSKARPSVGVAPHNLAYVLYTSGSTGKPKGVQIEHRSIVNFLTSMRKRIAFDADDVLLAVTTMSFDIAGLELYLPLMTGARVIIADRRMVIDGRRLVSAIEENRVTVMQATPVTWQLLLDAGWRKSSMRVLCGGETLRRDLAMRLIKNSPCVWNLYGPTETTIWSSIYRVVGEDQPVVPIGRPIANTQMHILDSALDPVPIGETGELYIGGDGLARGYLNRPELTAQKFVSNPFRSGTRLYKTGDLARYLPSGDVEFLGRTDHQVKIRGFRIELGEIEAILEERSDIVHAVVATSGTGSDIRLIAYFVAKAGFDPGGGELNRWLKGKLPDYMIPAAFVKLDSMPLTENAKVDRHALPPPNRQEYVDENSSPPRDQLEAQLVNIWEAALGRSGIGIRDNFFDLGGYSVLAARVAQRIDEELGKRLPIIALFRAPTIEELAALLRKAKPTEEWSSPFVVPPETENSRTGLPHRRSGTNGLQKSMVRKGFNRLVHLLCRVLPGASSVRPFLHRLRGVRIESQVFVGDDVYIENDFPECVEIHQGATIGLRTTIVAHTGGAGRVIIGKKAFIGANSLLVTAGNRTLTIGEGSVLMAGSVVTTDVPPFTVYGVERAKPLAILTEPFTAHTSYEEFITSLRPVGWQHSPEA